MSRDHNAQRKLAASALQRPAPPLDFACSVKNGKRKPAQAGGKKEANESSSHNELHMLLPGGWVLQRSEGSRLVALSPRGEETIISTM
ncbi:hypothetical protein EYF80_035315 [Liparis tanakae]|uniref:Uncharacterized protein n=1 Tax=Liparis tanakae TaxID=230148 RepID=A0A4Z2GLQ5_9TELE|nr:hypothetical protein EYF80_035315 [Liparis tanakae]